MIKRMDDMALDPLRFPAPPREVRRSVARGCGMAGARLFILPHLCVGVGVFGAIVVLLAVLAFGQERAAVVTRRETNASDDGKTHHIHYRYDDGGRRYVERAQVSAAERDVLGPESVVRVKALHVGGFGTSVLVEPLRPTLRTLGFLLIFGVFWNGVLSLFVWQLWVVPRRQLWLARHGQAIVGHISRKSISTSDDTTTYQLTYSYRVPGGSETYSRTQTVKGPAYAKAREGQTALVLYSAEQPKRSLLYEFSDYEVVGDGGGGVPLRASCGLQ